MSLLYIFWFSFTVIGVGLILLFIWKSAPYTVKDELKWLGTGAVKLFIIFVIIFSLIYTGNGLIKG
jgi:hypothetical protein